MLKPKQHGKRRKLYHFYNMIQNFNHLDYYRFIAEDETGKYKGYLYMLDDYKLNEDELNRVLKTYDNTKLYTVQPTIHGYTAGPKKPALFIGY